MEQFVIEHDEDTDSGCDDTRCSHLDDGSGAEDAGDESSTHRQGPSIVCNQLFKNPPYLQKIFSFGNFLLMYQQTLTLALQWKIFHLAIEVLNAEVYSFLQLIIHWEQASSLGL